jgi:hypothetical protein
MSVFSLAKLAALAGIIGVGVFKMATGQSDMYGDNAIITIIAINSLLSPDNDLCD